MTHICVSKLTNIGSDNGLSPKRRQAIIWTNAWILLIRLLGTNFNEILIGIQTFSFRKMHLKMSSAKRRPFSFGLNVLKQFGMQSVKVCMSMNRPFSLWAGVPVHEAGCLPNETDEWWLSVGSFSHPGQSCGYPGNITDGEVAPTADWMFDSYATYQCDSPRLSLVGNSNRKCVGDGPNVWWDGEEPQCMGKAVLCEQNFCLG